MTDLISRADAIEAVADLPNAYNGWSDTYDKACIIGVIEELPSAEAVSKGVVEQFRWERDVAMAQLEECGIPFGTNKDDDMVRVVRCKGCKHYSVEWETTRFGWCGYWNKPTDEMRYCSDGERRKE